MTTQDVAAQLGSSIDSRLGCSTISFRAWTLPGALAEISGQGFGEIDLGALPGVCDHVRTPLPPDLVDVLAEQILASGLAVRLINADVAEMNDPGLDAAAIQRRLRTLVDLPVADGQVDVARHGVTDVHMRDVIAEAADELGGREVDR